MGIPRSLIQCTVKKDLALNEYKHIASQQLNKDCKIKRLQHSQQLLQHFPTECSVRSLWFTVETLDLAIFSEDAYLTCLQYFGVMVDKWHTQILQKKTLSLIHI